MENISVIAQFKKKKPTDGHGTIYIRGYYNSKPVAAISTGHKVNYLHWDHDLRKVHDKAPLSKLVNTCIEIKLQDMKSRLMKLEIMGAKVNRSHIRKVIKGFDTGRNFILFCLDKINSNYTSKETIRSYKTETTKLQKFAGEVVLFSDLDYNFFERYRNYMRDELKNEPNTIWKSLKFINTFLNMAEKVGGIINENPMKHFDRGKYVETTPTWLEIEDCDRIHQQVVMNEDMPVMLRRVAIYFLFMCYSGLRYEDAISFNPATDIIDNERLVKQTHKFKVPVNIYLYARLTPIIDLIRQYPLKLSNQKFNMWLKTVAATAGITKDITAHVGRHSMGGFLMDAGLRLEEAQKVLGHKDKKSTKIYAHMKNSTIDAAVKKLNAL